MRSDNNTLSRGLILLPQWAKLIVSGLKTWEVRHTNTKIRGKVYIIASKVNLIVGEATLIDSFPLTEELYNNNGDKHRIICDYNSLPNNYKWVWQFDNAIEYDIPVEYKPKRGAQIWVNID